ncbi:MAG: YncE family protein [Gemmatimonadetes bacterium]|nr:YncE family protein [Gemmatimonadota bacterium]
MADMHSCRKPTATLAVALAGLALLAVPAQSQQRGPRPVRPATAPAPSISAARATPLEAPTSTYWVYVGAESADRIYRVRFGPDGAAVEKTIAIGELAAEMEGPHGLQVSPDGKWLYMTTGHGTPDGKLWKYDLGPDTLVGPGISLGKFPATLDLTPDGLYSFSANFNLHGEMVPSSISVVYTPTLTEVEQIETCTMPHGSRIDPTGALHYSGCMMDDQLIEINTRTFAVSRRFSVAKGKEGPIAISATEHAGHQMAQGASHAAMAPSTCSPTWAQPSADGKKIFVACNKADEILEIDRAKWAVSRRMATGRGPYNLSVTPDGKQLLVTLKQSAGFEIFDLGTGRSVGQFKNSTTVAHGVAVSPDSRYAFVSSERVGAQPGKVDVYDLKALAKVATADVGQQASGITFWKMGK